MTTTAGTAPLHPCIEVDGVTKWFGDVVAVSEISFTLDPGVTGGMGLLGVSCPAPTRQNPGRLTESLA